MLEPMNLDDAFAESCHNKVKASQLQERVILIVERHKLSVYNARYGHYTYTLYWKSMDGGRNYVETDYQYYDELCKALGNAGIFVTELRWLPIEIVNGVGVK